MSQQWNVQGLPQGDEVKMFDPGQFQPNVPAAGANANPAQNAGQAQQNGQPYEHQHSTTSLDSWNQAWGQADWNAGWNNNDQYNNQQVHSQQPPPQQHPGNYAGEHMQSFQHGQGGNFTAAQDWNQPAWEHGQGYSQPFPGVDHQPHAMQVSNQGSFPASQNAPNEGAEQQQTFPAQNTGIPNTVQSSGASAHQFRDVALDDQPAVSSTHASSAVGPQSNKPDVPHANSFSNLPHVPSPFDEIGSDFQGASGTSISNSFGMLAAPKVSGVRDGGLGDRVKFVIGSQPGSADHSGTASPYPQTDSPGMNASGLQQGQSTSLQQQFQQGPADTGIQHVSPPRMPEVDQAQMHAGERPPSTSSAASSHHGSQHSASAGDSLPGQIGLPVHVMPNAGQDNALPPVKQEDLFMPGNPDGSHHQRSYSGQSAQSVDNLSLSQSLQSSAGSSMFSDRLQESSNSVASSAGQNSELSGSMNAPAIPESAVATGPPPVPVQFFQQEQSKSDQEFIQSTQTGVQNPVQEESVEAFCQPNTIPTEQPGASSVPRNDALPVMTPDAAQPSASATPLAPVPMMPVPSPPTSVPIGSGEPQRMDSPVVSHPGSPFKPPLKAFPEGVKSAAVLGAPVESSVITPGMNQQQSPGASGPGPLGSSPAVQPRVSDTAAGFHVSQATVSGAIQSQSAPFTHSGVVQPVPFTPVAQPSAQEIPTGGSQSSMAPPHNHNPVDQIHSFPTDHHAVPTTPVEGSTNMPPVTVSGPQVALSQVSQVPSPPAQPLGSSPVPLAPVTNPTSTPISAPSGNPHAGPASQPVTQPDNLAPRTPQAHNLGSLQPSSGTPESLSQTSSQLELSSLGSVTLPSNLMENSRDAELTAIDQRREQDERQVSRYDSRDPRDRRDDRRDDRYDRDRRYDDRRNDDRDRRYDDRYRQDDPRHRPSSRGPPPDDRYRDPYRPSSRQGYPDDRPRSRQGYPDDRPRSRQGYPEERPRSRQGYPDDRPRSRQGYPDDPRYSRRDYPDDRGRHSRPSSRQGYPDDRPSSRPSSRGPEDQSRERPHSRGPQDGYHEYARGDHRRTYSQDDYYGQYSDRYRGYDYGYYGQQDRRGYYDNQDYDDYYMRQQRINRGYEAEMRQYNQPHGHAQQQSYDEYQRQYSGYSDEYDRSSQRSASRGNTPGPDSQADAFAQEFHRGSRPGSRGSGYEQSPVYSQNDQYRAYYNYYYNDPRYAQYYRQQRDRDREVPRGRRTPAKFAIPHLTVTLGPGGQLVKALPNNPADGQPARVEIRNLDETMRPSQQYDEMSRFPGPLVKQETHKNDVLLFCQKKVKECTENISLLDRDSAVLLWKYLELLIKQNGTVIGTDIAELLLEGHEPSTAEFSRSGMSIGDASMLVESDAADASIVAANRTVISALNESTDRFRHLLLHGRKKDALEWAMKNNLWGHALFLASKMDPKTHASIMTRFANVAMKMNDPLQTLYQLMSGRQPAAVTLVLDDKWGDWRPHLAMVLANPSQRPDVDKKSIVTLGDTLASKGCLYASQFCYLMAGQSFGTFHKKTSKLVLVSSSHHGLPFEEFASNAAVQCTEVYEYAQSLGNVTFGMPHFQPYKFIYACRLADIGLAEEALHYCEVISKTIQQAPGAYGQALVHSVLDLASRLKYHDPRRLQEEDMEDPEWLVLLGKTVEALDYELQQSRASSVPPMSEGSGRVVTFVKNLSKQFSALDRNNLQEGIIPPVQVSGSVTPMGFEGSVGSEVSDLPAVQEQSHDPHTQQTDQGQWPAQQQQQYDPNQQQQYDPNQQQQWDPNQQQQQWDPSQQQQQWDPTQQQQQQDAWAQYQQHYGGQQVQDPSQQQQQYDPNYTYNAQWNQTYDGSYTGFAPQQGQPAAQERHNSEQSEDSIDKVDGKQAPLTARIPNNIELSASMNSTMSDGSQSGEATPRANQGGFDYYAAATSPSQSPQGTRTDVHRRGSALSPHSEKVISRIRKSSRSSAGPSREQAGRRPSGGSARHPSGGSGTHGAPPPPPHSSAATASQSQQSTTKPAKTTNAKGAATSWSIGGFVKKLLPRGKNEMNLPDDKNPSIVWDADKQRWVNTDGEEEEEQQNKAPPPKDSDLMGMGASGAPPGPAAPSAAAGPPGAAPPSNGVNKFSRQKTKGMRGNYVDVLAGSSKKTPVSGASNLFDIMPKSQSVPANMFIPSSVAGAVDTQQAPSELASGDGQQQQQQQQQQPPAQQQFYNPAMSGQPATTDTSALQPPSEQNLHDLSRSSSQSSLSREVQQYTMPRQASGSLGAQPHVTGVQPSAAPPPGMPETMAPPPGVPMMFNPSQFSQNTAPAQRAPVGKGPKYGQRRAYPK